MSTSKFFALFFILLFTHSPVTTAEAYKLGPGDVIRIDVYGEDDLTFDRVLIGSKGQIKFPFVGDIRVLYRSVEQIERALTVGLKPDYLVDPKITVSVVEYRPFFINGEVRSPGGISFSPGLTLRKAISLAGGFTERASRSNITVLKENTADERPRKIGMDYSVEAGDVITVEQSFF